MTDDRVLVGIENIQFQEIMHQDGRILNQGGFVLMVGPQQEKFEIFDSNTNEIVAYHNSSEFAQSVEGTCVDVILPKS